MDRRTLLFGAALAAITIPGWSDAFAQESRDRAGEGRLGRAMDEARGRGRPLLVILGRRSSKPAGSVAPTWTLYLREGSDRALAELALCDLVCVPDDEVQRVFPATWREQGADAHALLVEPDGSARWIRAELPALPSDLSFADEAAFDALVVKRNALLEESLHTALAWDHRMVGRRRREQEAALSAKDRKRLAGKLDWDTPPERLHAELVPAFVLERAHGRRKRACLRLLADVAVERWLDGAPAGAAWETTIGCGGGPCGTGYVDPVSRRFLRFYTQDDATGRK